MGYRRHSHIRTLIFAVVLGLISIVAGVLIYEATKKPAVILQPTSNSDQSTISELKVSTDPLYKVGNTVTEEYLREVIFPHLLSATKKEFIDATNQKIRTGVFKYVRSFDDITYDPDASFGGVTVKVTGYPRQQAAFEAAQYMLGLYKNSPGYWVHDDPSWAPRLQVLAGNEGYLVDGEDARSLADGKLGADYLLNHYIYYPE